MTWIDLVAILLYFAAVIGAGVWFRRKAAENLEAYFLGGKSLHWSMLAMSGAVSNFDITGTMWMVSVLYLLGMQSWWHHWMWGVALPAFGLAYMAKWVRRSKVLTAAEWMVTRFGDGRDGRVARYAYALMAVVTLAAFIGYAFQGIGKFAVVYLPLDVLAARLGFDPTWLAAHQTTVLAVSIFAVTTLYVVIGGLYSVVVTDVIQTVVLTGAGIVIAGVAYVQLTPEAIAGSVPDGFTRLVPSWRMDHFAGTEHLEFQMFGLLVMAWVVKGLLMNAGGPSQMYDFQRYLAAANVRDACKLAAAWPFFLVVRWGMVMGITLLAMTGVMAVTDPEMVMPQVLATFLPPGVRGVVIAGLLAAFMSTFSSTVNAGASFLVRDLWQPIFRPTADERHLIRYSYVATVGIVVAGVGIGLQTSSIGEIWNWMMMALSAGAIVPNVLRWYWWRLSGWGYAAGILGGVLLAIVALYRPEVPLYVIFPAICLGSLGLSVLVSYATEPTGPDVLDAFYRTVRPFGLWGPCRKAKPYQDELAPAAGESPLRAVFNTAVGVVGLTGLYLAPMYLIGHWHTQAAACAACFAAAAVTLYFTWYRHMPRYES